MGWHKHGRWIESGSITWSRSNVVEGSTSTSFHVWVLGQEPFLVLMGRHDRNSCSISRVVHDRLRRSIGWCRWVLPWFRRVSREWTSLSQRTLFVDVTDLIERFWSRIRPRSPKRMEGMNTSSFLHLIQGTSKGSYCSKLLLVMLVSQAVGHRIHRGWSMRLVSKWKGEQRNGFVQEMKGETRRFPMHVLSCRVIHDTGHCHLCSFCFIEKREAKPFQAKRTRQDIIRKKKNKRQKLQSSRVSEKRRLSKTTHWETRDERHSLS